MGVCAASAPGPDFPVMPMTDEFRPAGRHTIARRFLEVSPDDSILEVGCHTGYFMRRYLIGKARKVRGTDIDKEAIAYAKAQDGDHYYICGNSNALPFAGGEFGKVLCAETLEHVDDEAGTIREITRVLKPHGLLVLTTPHRFLDSLDSGYPQHRHYSLEELAGMLPGFAIERVHRSELGGMFLVTFLLRFGRTPTLTRWVRHVTSAIEDIDCAINWGTGFRIIIAARKTKDA
jgi:2-polyprenyl-3-methyl-5-hydroxy-6-metoxy-1,4-benzoquinol methylase